MLANDAEGLGELGLDEGRGVEHEPRKHGLDLALLAVREGLGASIEVSIRGMPVILDVILE